MKEYTVEVRSLSVFRACIKAESPEEASRNAVKQVELGKLPASSTDVASAIVEADAEDTCEFVKKYMEDHYSEYHFDAPKRAGEPFMYELYANYDDRLNDKQIEEILDNVELGEQCLEDYLLENYYDEYENAVIDVADDIVSAMKDAGIEAEYSGVKEAVMDITAYRLPCDHFLSQEYDVDILLDTGDGNVDFTCNSWGLGSWDGESGKLDERSSLLWLAQQQGYTTEQFYNELVKGDLLEGKNFLESCRVEWYNQTSDLGAVTFLVKMPLRQLIRIHELMREDPRCGTIVLGKNTMCGLFDPWSGAGSVLELMLVKNVEIPVKYIWRALPDSLIAYWSVKDVYGMSGSAWKNTVKGIWPVQEMRSN